MRFGVNYIPSKDWLYSWLDFDEDSIKKDLETIKSLGFDHIRAHLIWSYFQVNETALSAHCMENLRKFADICEEVGIDYFLTLFTGWMSGFVFMPSWLNIGGPDCWQLGMFSNQRAINAEKFYIEEVAKIVGHRNTFLGFDLGNELNVIAKKHIDKDLDNETAAKWSIEIFNKCNEVAPGKLHNNGMAHSPWFGNIPFTRETLANDGDITPVHAWTPFTGTSGRYGSASVETCRLPNYMIEMAKAYCDDVDRKYWVQEFGMADQWYKNEEELETFITKTLENCASEENMWGITWWCSHDIQERFTGFVDFEHNLGVIDINNKPKPSGLIFKKFIENYSPDKYKKIKPEKALVILPTGEDEGDYTNAERYMELVSKNEFPAFIKEEKANDVDYLKSRGIKEIIM